MILSLPILAPYLWSETLKAIPQGHAQYFYEWIYARLIKAYYLQQSYTYKNKLIVTKHYCMLGIVLDDFYTLFYLICTTMPRSEFYFWHFTAKKLRLNKGKHCTWDRKQGCMRPHPVWEWITPSVSHLSDRKCNKHLLGTCCEPGMMLHIEDSKTNPKEVQMVFLGK